MNEDNSNLNNSAGQYGSSSQQGDTSSAPSTDSNGQSYQSQSIFQQNYGATSFAASGDHTTQFGGNPQYDSQTPYDQASQGYYQQQGSSIYSNQAYNSPPQQGYAPYSSQPYGSQPYGAQPSGSPYMNGYGYQNPQNGYPGYGVPAHPKPGASKPIPYGYKQKSQLVAAVLAFFLGTLGIHNFYLDKNARGAAQLGLYIFGWVTVILGVGVVIVGAVGIWAFVEFIMIIIGSGGYDRDGNGVPLD
ncbi:MAG: NINE protein [Corynebacterium sp.]|nr:NINE protein [Corynebacterium sp.]